MKSTNQNNDNLKTSNKNVFSRRLSKRMRTIADMVTLGSRVADIGCDHAYISIYLVNESIASHVIAMDVAEGPLSSASANISLNQLTDQIETRLSDGMDALSKGETDTAIIAGMGGYLVIDILKKGLEKLEPGYELILSPQSEIPEVRKFLREHFIEILDEQMMQEDGKYYNIIKAKFLGEATDVNNEDTKNMLDTTLSDNYGGKLIEKKSPVLLEYLEKRIEKLNGIYCRLSKEIGENTINRMFELRNEVDEISTVIEIIKAN